MIVSKICRHDVGFIKLRKNSLLNWEKTLLKRKENIPHKKPLAGTSGFLGMVGINKKMLKGGRTVITPSGMSMKKLCDPKYKTWIKGLLLFRATAYSIPIKYDKNVDISCKKYKIYKENLMEDRRSVHLDRSSSFFFYFNTFFTCYRK